MRSTGSPTPPPKVDDGEELLRGVKRNWIRWDPQQQKCVLALDAFHLRDGESALSVERAAWVPQATACRMNPATGKARFKALAGFQALPVRQCTPPELDVVAKSGRPESANIVGIPPGDPFLLPIVEEEIAFSYAKQLLDLCGGGWAMPPDPKLEAAIKAEHEADLA